MTLLSRSKWLILLSLVIFGISGCRYWSLYQFSQQFCEFDQQIEVRSENNQTGFYLIDPVLPRKVFQRYLAAHVFESHESNYELSDTYQIQSASDEKRYTFHTHFHLGSNKPLMIAGLLDQTLSQMFPQQFVEPVLRSFCSDDFDLSLKRLDARMEIQGLSDSSIPSKEEFKSAFGQPVSETLSAKTHQLVYEFHFLDANYKPQSKPVVFTLHFLSAGDLIKMRVQYHKYDYTLDVGQRKARLIAIRRK